MSEETMGAEPTSEPQGAAPAGGAPTAQDAAQQIGEAMESGELSEADLDRVVTVKVNGAPQRMKVRDVVSNYTLRAASHQKFEEANRIRKAAESEREQVKSLVQLLQDPDGMMAVAEQMGIPLRELKARIDRELATPDDVKRMRDIERRERALKERDEAEQAAKRKAREDAETRTARERYVADITSAATSAGLPKTPVVVRAMAQLMLAAQDAGAPITAAEAAESVREEFRGLVGGVVKDSEPDSLRTLLGQEKLEALRKSEVERAVKNRDASRPSVRRAAGAPDPNPAPRKLSALMSPEEYSRHLDELQGRRK